MPAPNDRDPVDEAALAALFDRSASLPSDDERWRLATGAERVAERRRPRRVATIVWPAALAAAAGVAYLAVAPPRHEFIEAPASSVAEHYSASPLVGSATAPATPVVPASSAAVEAEPEDPVATVLGGEPEDWDPLDLAPLMRGEESEGAPRKGR